MSIKKVGLYSGVVVLVLATSLIAYYLFSFKPGMELVEKEWMQSSPEKIVNLGSTKTLSVLPLVNWHTANDSLKGEAGVSYLIKTDNQTILFDVGFNREGESPSPLQHNMKQLGVELDDIDTLFLSHHHLDHSGGQGWVNKNTFSLGVEQVDLSDKKIFATTQLEYPNAQVTATPNASVIGEGLASIGAISRQLFMGRIEEQALAINVQGKGLVLIVGCGHQTLPKILKRAEQVFDEPVYGLVGDLHYPLPMGRLSFLGLNLQRIFASGDGPLEQIDQQAIDDDIDMLKQLNPGVIGLGGHDTSDEVIERFNSEFAQSYQHVRVGQWITIAE